MYTVVNAKVLFIMHVKFYIVAYTMYLLAHSILWHCIHTMMPPSDWPAIKYKLNGLHSTYHKPWLLSALCY